MRMPPSAHVVITDSTGVVAILGDALEQARAPGLVDAIPAERGQDAELVPLRVAREAAGDDRVGSARAVPSSRGAVMTMPHKTAVVDLLDEVLPDAGLVGACNVIRREADGPLLGTMLDFMIGPCDGRAAR